MTETIEKNNNLEEVPFEFYLENFQKADPLEIEARTHIPYDQETRTFTVSFLKRTYKISWPQFEVSCIDGIDRFEPLTGSKKTQILVLRFLLETVPTRFAGEFISYRDIPSGEVYYRQFNGRCMQRLAFSFGTRPAVFCSALENMGAEKIDSSDHGYEIEIFPGYDIRFLLWEADEEFPPSTQILFGDNISSAFHGEDLVVMSEIVINTMKKVQ